MAVTLLLSLAVAAAPVSGDSTCPSPAELATQLDRTVPESAWPKGARVRVERKNGHLALSLFDGRETLLGQRELDATGTCPELAAASAVVVATWLTELSTTDIALPPAAPKEPPAPAIAFDAAAGLTGSISAGPPALGAMLTATAAPRAEGLGGRLTVGVFGPRALRVGGGVVTWHRVGVGLGGHRRWARGDWRLDLSLETVGALTGLTGDEQTAEATRTRFDYGMSVGVRGLHQGLWLGLFGYGWPRPNTISVPAGSAELPQLELQLAAGVAFSNH